MLLLGLIVGLLAALMPPQPALAHPLDVYLQATYITVAPSGIVVELDLSPGVLVAPQMLPQLDSNGDQVISEAESQAYADTVIRNVVLHVDGQPLTLAVTKIEMPPYLTIQAGYGTIRLFTTAGPAPVLAGGHELTYQNNFAPAGSTYQVNAFVDKGVAVTLGKQNRDNLQRSLTLDYNIGSAAPATAGPVGPVSTNTVAGPTATPGGGTPFATTTGASPQTQQLLAYLYQPALSPWILLLALGLAALLGGLHALTPGHGKTLAAAYLVGSRGTVRHAVALGRYRDRHPYYFCDWHWPAGAVCQPVDRA